MRKIKMKNRSKVGSAFENALKNFLQDEMGFIVVRSAASKTPIDLIALREDTVIIIQCKSTKTTHKLSAKIIAGKKFKDFEDLNTTHLRCVAYYSYVSKKCRVFDFNYEKKIWNDGIDFKLEV